MLSLLTTTIIYINQLPAMTPSASLGLLPPFQSNLFIASHFSTLFSPPDFKQHHHLTDFKPTSYKQQIKIQRLFNIPAIIPDFCDSVPTFHEKTRKQICTLGVFPFIQTVAFSLMWEGFRDAR